MKYQRVNIEEFREKSNKIFEKLGTGSKLSDEISDYYSKENILKIWIKFYQDILKEKNKDEKVKHITYVPRGTGYQRRVAWFITESGLYTAILESHLPQAKPFKKWVTHEVLPCIRKHGYYTKDQARLDRILKIANIVENENYMIEGVR